MMARMSEVAETPAAPDLPEGWEFKEHAEVTPLGRTYPVRAWKLPEEPEEGITVDIVEMTPPPEGGRKGPATLHVPTYVVVNGRRFFTPRGTKIKVEACGEDATTVTLTFHARRVRVGHADELLND